MSDQPNEQRATTPHTEAEHEADAEAQRKMLADQASIEEAMKAKAALGIVGVPGKRSERSSP